jgi:hypothetical protein
MQPLKPSTTLTRDELLTMPLHPTEVRLLACIRDLGHGSLLIKVVAGVPVMIEHGIKQIKLT